MKLTIVLLGRASADLETLCRVSTKRRILARKASDRNAINYQSAEPRRQALPSHQPLAHQLTKSVLYILAPFYF